MQVEQAMRVLDLGVTLTHDLFSNDETIRLHCKTSKYTRVNGELVETTTRRWFEFEDGVVCSDIEFWIHRKDIGFDKGWRLLS